MVTLLRLLQEFEGGFHPHKAESSPLGISTMTFQGSLHVPLITVVFYIAGIALGHKLMKERQAFQLKKALAGWNLFLSVFSAVGAYRTVPVLVSNLLSHPFRRSLCTAAAVDWGAGPCGLWVQLFIVSKFAELADTAFIILRKRKLLLLHWYHHATVLVYCYHAYGTEAPHALYFVAMNYTVHALMYGYYALMALNKKPYWIPPEVVTIAQIAQMIGGVAIQLATLRERLAQPPDCILANGWNIFFGCVMYASYLALFVKFALDRYLFGKHQRGKVFTSVAGHDKPANVRLAFPVFFKVVDVLDYFIRKYRAAHDKTTSILNRITSRSQLDA